MDGDTGRVVDEPGGGRGGSDSDGAALAGEDLGPGGRRGGGGLDAARAVGAEAGEQGVGGGIDAGEALDFSERAEGAVEVVKVIGVGGGAGGARLCDVVERSPEAGVVA